MHTHEIMVIGLTRGECVKRSHEINSWATMINHCIPSRSWGPESNGTVWWATLEYRCACDRPGALRPAVPGQYSVLDLQTGQVEQWKVKPSEAIDPRAGIDANLPVLPSLDFHRPVGGEMVSNISRLGGDLGQEVSRTSDILGRRDGGSEFAFPVQRQMLIR